MNVRALLDDEEFDLHVRRDGERYSVRIGERSFDVELTEPEPGVYSLLAGDGSYEVVVRETGEGLDVALAGRTYRMEMRDPADLARGGPMGTAGSQVIRSMMAGKVIDVMVGVGDEVAAGAPLLVIEAMKMENEIRSPRDGVVRSIAVAAGQPVESGAELVVVD